MDERKLETMGSEDYEIVSASGEREFCIVKIQKMAIESHQQIV